MDNINKLIKNTKDIDLAGLANPNLKDADVIQIWDEVSSYIEKLMLQSKGVTIPGFGTFSFVQKKIEIGNSKYLLTHRPVFAIAEKFSQTHALKCTKYPVAGHIPIHPLNYAAISSETIYKRDDIESCVRHVLQVFNRSIASRKNVEFTFTSIGKLQIRDSKVKMRFFKTFVNLCDNTGRVIEDMQNRPNTLDSVLSRNDFDRPGTRNTCILPRLHSRAGVDGAGIGNNAMDTISEENPEDKPQKQHTSENADETKQLAPIASFFSSEDGFAISVPYNEPKFRIPDAFSANEAPPQQQQQQPELQRQSSLQKSSSVNDFTLKPVENTEGFLRKPSSKQFYGALRAAHSASPNLQNNHPSPCGHNCGQELCYLCHQRGKRNVPVYFDSERKQKETEEDDLLLEYQNLIDLEKRLQDETKYNLRRMDRAKMDAFNLNVAEANKVKKLERTTTEAEIPRSFVFRRRLRTPPKFIRQQDLADQLNRQLESKAKEEEKFKKEKEYVEKLEQVKLAEDLALQRELYLRDKYERQTHLKNALDFQVQNKPYQLPRAEPDGEVFGKDDMNAEKLFVKRMYNKDVAQSHKDQVEDRKREELLRQIREQEEDEANIARDKHELIQERTRKYLRQTNQRKNLENEWFDATAVKKDRDREEKQHRLASDGLPVHEQCDKYKRCTQCRRKLNNLGASNIWSETRYIPGCRIMV